MDVREIGEREAAETKADRESDDLARAKKFESMEQLSNNEWGCSYVCCLDR